MFYISLPFRSLYAAPKYNLVQCYVDILSLDPQEQTAMKLNQNNIYIFQIWVEIKILLQFIFLKVQSIISQLLF